MAGLGRCALPAGHAAEGRARLRRALDSFNRIGATEASDVSAELEGVAATAVNRPTSAWLPRQVWRSGIGSHPPECHGPHLRSLVAVNQPPRITPYSLRASTAYWLQVGTKRHDAGRSGEIMCR